MFITRDGKVYTLTEEEIRQAWEAMEHNRLRSVVEGEVEDNGYSFGNYSDFGYGSEGEFREDFIDKCIEDLQEKVEVDYGIYSDFVGGVVEGNAEDFDLEPEF